MFSRGQLKRLSLSSNELAGLEAVHLIRELISELPHLEFLNIQSNGMYLLDVAAGIARHQSYLERKTKLEIKI